jgi:arylsulfatase A-like enzyme
VRAINRLNHRYDQTVDDPEIATRIAQYEMAFQMQTSVPGLMDTTGEPERVRESYGCTPGDGSFASNCLLARRLAERGVRFIQLYHRDWDHHNGLREYLPGKARETDRACAALVTDLKERGLLDDTLVVWAGEFGRTPMAQTNKGAPGRDHHNKGFSIWLAGGGIKRGFSWGATDELGYSATENVVSVHDLHATMLHLLGVDHLAFTYKFQGLDARLSGVEKAEVVKGILT